jgi:hypothetical protein
MRTIAPLDEGPYSYARMGLRGPRCCDADSQWNESTTYTYDYANRLAVPVLQCRLLDLA